MKSDITINFLAPTDRIEWEVLARGYKEFYQTPISDDEFATAWERLIQRDELYGLGATVDGNLVGIAHYLFHTSVWAPRSCYLQDVFTAREARGQGVARALIETVASKARAAGSERFYWQTKEDNATARRLYDTLGQHNGFIRYDYPLS